MQDVLIPGNLGKADQNIQEYVVRCAIWYHLSNLKNVKNTRGGVLLLVKLQVWTNGTKSRKTSHIHFSYFLKILC